MKTKLFIGFFFLAVLFVITEAAISEDYNRTVIVTIKGNVKNVKFNGRRQSSVGYTIETNSRHYNSNDFVCYAIDSVSAVQTGTYNMGISSDDFCNVNPKYKNVVFVVTDGSLSINDSQSPLICAIEKR